MSNVKLLFFPNFTSSVEVNLEISTNKFRLDRSFFQRNIVHGNENCSQFSSSTACDLVSVFEKSYKDEKCVRTVRAEDLLSLSPEYSLRSPKAVLALKLCWLCSVTVRHSQDKKKNNLLFSFVSNDENSSFEAIIRQINKDYPDCFLTDDQNNVIDIPSLYENPRADIRWNLMPLQANYSDLKIPQVSCYVEFEAVGTTAPVLDNLKKNLYEKINNQKDMINSINFLEPIAERCKLFRDSLIPDAERNQLWNNLVDITHQRLTAIHSIFPASSNLSETARRIIIDQFIISVCDFMRTTLEVEYKIKVSKHQIGWGSLDYKFGEAVMKVTVEDPSELKIEEEEEEEEEEEMDEEVEVEGRGEFEASIEFQSTSAVLEAKERLNDQGCAQVTAQQYDLSFLEGRSLVRGILSTGTKWDFLKLQRNGGTKPVLSYEGERVLNIVLDNSVGSKRRPSALVFSEPVSRVQVDEIMVSIASSMESF